MKPERLVTMRLLLRNALLRYAVNAISPVIMSPWSSLHFRSVQLALF